MCRYSVWAESAAPPQSAEQRAPANGTSWRLGVNRGQGASIQECEESVYNIDVRLCSEGKKRKEGWLTVSNNNSWKPGGRRGHTTPHHTTMVLLGRYDHEEREEAMKSISHDKTHPKSGQGSNMRRTPSMIDLYSETCNHLHLLAYSIVVMTDNAINARRSGQDAKPGCIGIIPFRPIAGTKHGTLETSQVTGSDHKWLRYSLGGGFMSSILADPIPDGAVGHVAACYLPFVIATILGRCQALKKKMKMKKKKKK
ncbi:hypothetical protein L249_5044, partial [Ophiocordyceps polyrhachis-furcata BCC 54312]